MTSLLLASRADKVAGFSVSPFGMMNAIALPTIRCQLESFVPCTPSALLIAESPGSPEQFSQSGMESHDRNRPNVNDRLILAEPGRC
jgi:hypothetical protein